jgi:hypothetical protein
MKAFCINFFLAKRKPRLFSGAIFFFWLNYRALAGFPHKLVLDIYEDLKKHN